MSSSRVPDGYSQHLVHEVLAGRMTRRELLVKATVLGLSVTAIGSLLAACGEDTTTDTSAQKAAIVFVSWGGVYQEAQQKAWLDPFAKANPDITIVQDSPSDYSKIKAMVEAGNVTWDTVDVQKDFGIGSSDKYCEKIDDTKIPFADLTPDLLNTDGYRVPVMIASDVIAYRTDDYGDQKPASFADFYDVKKFPGKRGVYNWSSGSILEEALLADGVAPENLYPLDLDRAFKKIATIKDYLVWWETGAQSQQLLADHEVSMAMAWNGRVTDIQKQGTPVAIVWEQHFVEPDSLVIPKGSKNVEATTKLLQWIVAPENNAELSKYIAYAPSNLNSVDKVGADVAPDMSTSHLDTAVKFDDIWWGENYDEVNQQFTEFVQEL